MANGQRRQNLLHMGKGKKEMRVKHEKHEKLPLICRMCKAKLVKYFCKNCPPLSAQDLPMTEEEAHALNMQMRYDEEAKGIISKEENNERF